MRRAINLQQPALGVKALTQPGLVAEGSFGPVDTLQIPVLDFACL